MRNYHDSHRRPGRGARPCRACWFVEVRQTGYEGRWVSAAVRMVRADEVPPGGATVAIHRDAFACYQVWFGAGLLVLFGVDAGGAAAGPVGGGRGGAKAGPNVGCAGCAGCGVVGATAGLTALGSGDAGAAAGTAAGGAAAATSTGGAGGAVIGSAMSPKITSICRPPHSGPAAARISAATCSKGTAQTLRTWIVTPESPTLMPAI